MSVEILASVFTLMGVVVSVSVSLYVGSRQVRAELQKLKGEFQQAYATKLLEKRLETYPKMAYILSNFFKEVKRGDELPPKTPINSVKNWSKQIDDWDSKNYIFMSAYTSAQMGELRDHLFRLLKKHSDKSKKFLKTDDMFKKVMKFGENLEFALKSDLGVYELDFDQRTKRVEAYEDIVKEMSRIS